MGMRAWLRTDQGRPGAASASAVSAACSRADVVSAALKNSTSISASGPSGRAYIRSQTRLRIAPAPTAQSGRSRLRTARRIAIRSEEHTSELQSLMRISYAVFCLKKKNNHITEQKDRTTHDHEDTPSLENR